MQCNNMPLKHAAAGKTTQTFSLETANISESIIFTKERKLGGVNGLIEKHILSISSYFLLFAIFSLISINWIFGSSMGHLEP